MGKTHVIWCISGKGHMENRGMFPCGICNIGVEARCTASNSWIHKKCSSIRGRLHISGFRCKRCVDGDSGQSEVLRETLLGFGKDWSALEASRAKVRSAWAKFRDLASTEIQRNFPEVKEKNTELVCIGL